VTQTKRNAGDRQAHPGTAQLLVEPVQDKCALDLFAKRTGDDHQHDKPGQQPA
jgi:hypothetical protein